VATQDTLTEKSQTACSAESIDPTQIQKLSAVKAILIELSCNKGVFLGDSHGDVEIPKFVSSNLPLMKQAGVQTLFFEMVKSAENPRFQELLKKGDKDALEKYFDNAGWNKGPGSTEAYSELVLSAQKTGIKVVGIDIDVRDFSRRLEISNLHWKDVIDQSLKTEAGKFIVFGGLGHSANYPANKGVDYLLSIPSFDFRIQSVNTPSGGEQNEPQVVVGNGKDNKYGILILPSSKKSP